MTEPRRDTNFSITLEEMMQDIASAADTGDTVSEANGDHRSNLKAIIENRGYHKKAFSDFRAMAAMSDSKFADYWRTFSVMFETYRDEAEKRIQDLVDKADAASNEMESDML